MNNKVIKFLSMGLGGAVGLLGIVLILVALSNASNPDGLGGSLDGFFYVIYIALAVCVVVALLFGVLQTVTAPKKSLGLIAGIVLLVLVFVVGYSMAGEEVNWVGKTAEEIRKANEMYSAGIRKFSGAAVNTSIALLLIGVGSILLMEVYRLIKR